MHRTFFTALLGGALVVAGLAAPAVASDTAVVVHGVAFPDSLIEFRDSCTTIDAPTPPEPTRTLRHGGARGSHALGWQFDATDSEVGTLAFVDEPASLTTFGLSVLAPGGTASGNVVGIYYDDTPGFTDGYWIGFAGFDHAGDGWIRWNAADASLSWSYIQPGSSQFNVASGTIRDFATSRGGDGGGGWAGAAFGCDGEQFFLDRLTVGGSDTTTYDLEGLTTRSHMEWSTDGKKVRNGNKLKVQYGQKFWLLGHSDGAPVGGSFEGRGALMAKDYGRSKFRQLATNRFTPRLYAGFRVWAPRRTVFYFDSNPTDFFESDASERVTVEVQAVVRAQIEDRKLIEGQRLAVEGLIKPGNRGVKVTLQRRVNGRWVALSRGRTRAQGEFRLSTTARSPGRWTVRVLVASGKGNLGTRSSTRTVTVDRRPVQQPPPPVTDPTPEPDVIDTPVAPSVPPAPPDPNYRRIPSDALLLRPVGSACTMPGPYQGVPCRAPEA